MMDKNWITGFIMAYATTTKDISEEKRKKIAVTSSISSLLPHNNIIAPLIVAKQITPLVEQNESLENEVNNRIIPRQISKRYEKEYDQIIVKNKDDKELTKKMIAIGMRIPFTNLHLKLIRKQSSQLMQEIIDITLKIKEDISLDELEEMLRALAPSPEPDTPDNPNPNPTP